MIRRQFLAALACVPGVGVLLRGKTSARGRRLTFVAQNGESHTIYEPTPSDRALFKLNQMINEMARKQADAASRQR